MTPRALCLLALAGPVAASEGAIPVPPSPPDAAAIAQAPEAARADLQAALAAFQANDLQAAVDKLRAARADGLAADLRRTVDRCQDGLAERLAQDNLGQAAAQERAGKWAYAQRFLLMALASRMRACDELRALWGRPAAVAALGGAAQAQAELSLAAGHGPDALRWRLAGDRAEGHLTSQAAIDDLAALAADAGDADADLVQLLRAALAQAGHGPLLTAFPDGAASADRLRAIAAAAFGADDEQVAALRRAETDSSYQAGIAALGAHELEIGVAVDLGLLRLRARAASAASPATSSGGFAAASASDSDSATATAERLEVRCLRAANPPGAGPLLPVFGGGLTASAFQAKLEVPISDAGPGGSNLTGLSYHGAYGAQGIGLEAIGGVRVHPASHPSLRVSLLGVIGAEAMRTSLGTRPDAAGGSAASSTIHGAGLGLHAGLESDLVVRPWVAWQAELGLGLDWERLPGAGGAGAATFINGSGTATAPGSESTGVSGVSAVGIWLRLGASHCW